MAERKVIPIILHGKENKFQMADNLEENKQSVKNELDLLRTKNVNLLREPCKSMNFFENHVGKLNEVCTRRSVDSPGYIVCVTENGEFIIQCKMFDNSVTQGRSKSRKDAKHKAAEAMLQLLNEREEARCQQFLPFQESAENVSVPIVNVTEDVNVKLNSSAELHVINHVGKLNENFKNFQRHPKYRFCGSENGEFIIECKLSDNTITRGRSKSKKVAKQKAAEAMLLVLNQSQESQNTEEKSMCSNHLDFVKPTKNLTENVTEPFENHVENMNKIFSTTEIKQSLDKPSETENWEIINGCKIIDNTCEQPKLKIDSVEVMLDKLNNDEDLRNDNEESQCQKYLEVIKRAKKLTNSTLSVNENINVKLCSSVETLENHVGKSNKALKSNSHFSYQVPEAENGKLVTECTIVEEPKFKKVERPKAAEVLLSILKNSEKWKYDREKLGKDREESMNDGEKPTYQKVIQLIKCAKNLSNTAVNLTENGSIRLSAPTDPTNKIYYKSKKKYLLDRVCKTDHSEEYKIFEKALMRKQLNFKQNHKPKPDKVMSTVLSDNDKWKNDEKASNKLTAKKNVTDTENFRLSSEQFENHIEAREETYYKYNKKSFLHRVCKSRPQNHVKVIKCANDLTSSTMIATENVSDELRSSTPQFESHIEKLNKTFSKRKKHFLRSTCRRIENDELAADCNIFEDTQEQSDIKKYFKPKASDELLALLSDSETLRTDREELIRQKHMEFYKCAKRFPIPRLNVRKKERFINSEAETFENYVKESQGQSRYKQVAKQKSSKEMHKIHAGGEKMRRQRSMESLEEYKVSNNQRTPLVGLDTDIIVERNASSNKSTNLVANNTSSVQFTNYVGKLNEYCFKEVVTHPLYTTFKIESGEFIIKCEMFDKTYSHGRSTTKKDAKQEAAKAMIQMMSKSMFKYQRQQDTKSFQSGEFSEFLSNATEKKHFCSQPDMPSSSTDENDNSLDSSTDSFENHVGTLNDFCLQRACEVPIYIEHLSENRKCTCECIVINDTIETVTLGRSTIRKDAKQKAAQEMIEILIESSKLEHQTLMKSITIIDTTDNSQQNPMDELSNQIAVKQSDWSSIEYMNEHELKMELKDLNINYTITAVKKTTNALKLKTKRSADYKSLTFMSTGESRIKISLNLLRKAVFGFRILKK